MELLSRAYFQAVVAQAGGTCVAPTPDFGIDFDVHDVASDDGKFSDVGVVMHVQLKSTTEAVFVQERDIFQYDLEMKAYNSLRKHPVNVPWFLVLFIMPKDETIWLNQDHEGMILRHCAYYLSLAGMPEVANEDRVRVTVPRQQVFSVPFLQQWFQPR
jgi:hypothetical protein